MSRLRSLREQMSATSNMSLWTRWTTHIVRILTDIQNSFRLVLDHAVGHLLDQLLVLVADRRNVARRVLGANAIVLSLRCVILSLKLGFVFISHHDLVWLILLLRKLVVFGSICTELLGSRCTSYRSSNRIALFIARPLWVVTLFFNHELILSLSATLLLVILNDLVALPLELRMIIESSKLLLRLVWSQLRIIISLW